jgi:hypothetical protein
MHRDLGVSPFPQRTTHAGGFFSGAKSKLHLPRHWKAIILADQAGIDPVGASYPNVSCPP